MKIFHQGSAVKIVRYGGEPTDRFSVWDWGSIREVAKGPAYDRMDRIVTEGVITDDGGSAVTGVELERVRHRLLGTYDGLLELPGWRSDLGNQERRWLIPGLWPWGTIPMLGGNPKAGKSTLVVDLTAALIVPEHRFLDHFEPSRLTVDELSRGVLLINAETPPVDLVGALRPLLDVPLWFSPRQSADAMVEVVHLERVGGPQMFDLTDPALYDLWSNRLISCEDCDGRDDWAPSVVIVAA